MIRPALSRRHSGTAPPGRPGSTSRRCSIDCSRRSNGSSSSTSLARHRPRSSTSAAAPAGRRWPSPGGSAQRRDASASTSRRRWSTRPARVPRARPSPRSSCAPMHRRTPSSRPPSSAIVSRFGVMFFDDPDPGVRQPAAGSAHRRQPARHRLAQRRGEPVHDRRPSGPPRRCCRTCRRAGRRDRASSASRTRSASARSWPTAAGAEVDIQPIDVACALTESDLDRYLARLGPVGLLLREADEPTRRRVHEVVRTAFEPYVEAGMARFTAACWVVDARAGAGE